MRLGLFIPLLLFCNAFALCQSTDSIIPQTIHIQRTTEVAYTKVNTASPITPTRPLDTVNCTPTVGKAWGGIRTYKLSREEILSAGAIKLRGKYSVSFHPAKIVKLNNGTPYVIPAQPNDTIWNKCTFKVVSFKMKFARKISKYGLKNVLKVDSNKYYLVATNGNFTNAMMNVLEVVPKGEKVLIYGIKAQKPSGAIKKLKRITLKLI
jgi:hypothetical protein